MGLLVKTHYQLAEVLCGYPLRLSFPGWHKAVRNTGNMHQRYFYLPKRLLNVTIR